jgi:hypothetical protein
MKKYTWAGIAILGLLFSACGNVASGEPTISPQDIQSTAVAAAFTIVAETHAAVPTDTAVPPTDTPVPTSLPTDTPVPSPTAAGVVAESPTAVAIIPTFTSQPAVSAPTSDPCNKPLTSWDGPSADLDIFYDYSPQRNDDKVVVSIWVMSDKGECGYLVDLTSGPVGQYSVAAYVDGEKDFKVFGGFRLTEAAWEIVIRNDTIVALGGCYPSC